MSSPRLNQIFHEDGHRLAWAEYGPSDGTPVLYLHGGNDCGLEAGWFAGDLDPTTRVIAPDRPGFGGSTFVTGRRFADVVPDVHRLLDHLSIDTAPAFGLSGGGPHVLALGALSDRISKVAAVASPCPLQSFRYLRGTWFPIRLAYLAARYAPDWLLLRIQRAMNDAERNMRYAHRMRAPDAALFQDNPERMQRVIESVTAAHAQGFEGAVHEWRLYTRPWGFDLSGTRTPTTLWYGDQDGMAPVAMGRRLAELIPGSCLTVLEGEAHLSLIHHHARAIVADLFGLPSDRPRR